MDDGQGNYSADKSYMAVFIKTEDDDVVNPTECLEIEINVTCVKEERDPLEQTPTIASEPLQLKEESGLQVSEDAVVDGEQECNKGENHKATEKPLSEEKLLDQEGESHRFVCGYCQKPYKNQHSLRQHVERTHSTDSLTCIKCNREFKCREYLLSHITNMHSKQEYECKSCTKVFKAKMLLEKHVKNVHTNTKFECFKCKRQFRQGGNLRRHLSSVHGDPRFECVLCKRMFKAKHLLRSHMRHVHKGKSEDINNTATKKSIESAKNNKIQEQESHAPLYKCELCDKIFESDEALMVHSERGHDSESYRCDECQINFRSRKYLVKHMSSTHGAEQFKCDLCYKIFQNQSYLDFHMQYLHANMGIGRLQLHKCSICLKEFRLKSNLRKHEKRTKCSRQNVGAASTSTQQHNQLDVKDISTDVQLGGTSVRRRHVDCSFRLYNE